MFFGANIRTNGA